MSKRKPRYEIVHNPGERQPWWGRYVAGNGRIRWTTESYHRRAAVISAIEDIAAARIYGVDDRLFIGQRLGTLEVREVDERTFPSLGDVL